MIIEEYRTTRGSQDKEDKNTYAKTTNHISDTNATIVKTIHYIKYFNGRMYDPYSGDIVRSSNIKWTKVSAEVYDMYVKFLNTGSKKFLSHAERLV